MLFNLPFLQAPFSWLLWVVCTVLLNNLLVAGASYGIRQRNSTLPLRQLVDKSKSKATNLNTFAHNSPICTYCDVSKCAQDGEQEAHQMYCLVVKHSDEVPEESCANEEEMQRLLPQNQAISLKSGAEGCQLRQNRFEHWQICWCRQKKPERQPEVGLTKNEEGVFSPVRRHSRLSKAKNGLHHRASRYRDIRAQSLSGSSLTSTWFTLLFVSNFIVPILSFFVVSVVL